MEEQFSKDAVPERVYALADTAMGRVGEAHFCRALIRSVFEYDAPPIRKMGSDKAIRQIARSGLRAIFG